MRFQCTPHKCGGIPAQCTICAQNTVAPRHPQGASLRSTHLRCSSPSFVPGVKSRQENHLPLRRIFQLGRQMAQKILGPSQCNQFPAEDPKGGPRGNANRNPATASAAHQGLPGLLLPALRGPCRPPALTYGAQTYPTSGLLGDTLRPCTLQSSLFQKSI